MSLLDVAAIKADFPILSRTVRDGKKLVYLDSGATSQKPRKVLDAEREFYEKHNAAVHRGAHQLAEEATDAYELARQKIANFVNAKSNEIVFTKNATEAINLVAYAFLNATLKSAHGKPLPEGSQRFILKPGDEILVTEMEHHANLVPWQELTDKTGATLKWIGLGENGRLDLSNLDQLINAKTKIVALAHQSNLLGTINEIDVIVQAAKKFNAIVLLDACQSVPHMRVDVRSLEVDFITWSGHKMLGPLGIGCLWGRSELLHAMPPFITGGSMIATVSMEKTTFADPPARFEAGVPMAAQAVGLAAAVDYLTAIGMENVAAHEHHLTELGLKLIGEIPGVRIIGPTESINRGSAISFVVDEIHPHDLGQVLDEQGIAVRVGQHCAKPACNHYGVQATTRATFYIYNDESDVYALRDGILKAKEFFGVTY
jgi:cysteine desulfurase/selenocysteine lyase